jgi:hypothetical protein
VAKDVSEIDLEVFLTKPATDLQDRFADWIMEQVGYDPSGAKTKEAAFREGVRIATATRMVFQASPENKEATKAKRDERRAAVADEDEAPKGKKGKPAPEPEPVKPAKGKKGKSAPVVEDVPVAPKGKKGTKGKGRRAAATADDEETAPF